MTSMDLGGAKREFRFSWKALKRLWKEHNINLLGPLDAVELNNPDTVTAFVWAGLLHANPDLTLEQVDEWIELDKFAQISQALAEALMRDMGVSQDESDPTSG